jgi:hypothetical protein
MPKSDDPDPARTWEASRPSSGSPEAPKPTGNCPHMTACPMFGLFSLAGTLATWKTNYCAADYTRCERYQRSLQGRVVPNNLMPNGALLRKWTPPR